MGLLYKVTLLFVETDFNVELLFICTVNGKVEAGSLLAVMGARYM